MKKICKIHGELKEKDIKSGIYRNKKYRKCRMCENDRSKEYREKLSIANVKVWAKRKTKKLEEQSNVA